MHEVKAGIRSLIADLGEQGAPRLKANAAAFPEGCLAAALFRRPEASIVLRLDRALADPISIG